MSTVRIVCTILSTKRGLDIMSKLSLAEFCQQKLLKKYYIVPYGEHEYAIYNKENKQYVTLYSNLSDAYKDLELFFNN